MTAGTDVSAQTAAPSCGRSGLVSGKRPFEALIPGMRNNYGVNEVINSSISWLGNEVRVAPFPKSMIMHVAKPLGFSRLAAVGDRASGSHDINPYPTLANGVAR